MISGRDAAETPAERPGGTLGRPALGRLREFPRGAHPVHGTGRPYSVLNDGIAMIGNVMQFLNATALILVRGTV